MGIGTAEISSVVRALMVGILLIVSNTVSGGIGIKPAYVEVDMDDGRPAGRFIITNNGEEEERYRVNAIHFTYSPQGGLTQSPDGQWSLAPWIRFNPKEITLAPKTQVAVRFAVVSRGKLQQGEYWAAMELESLNVTYATSKNEETGRSVRLKTISTIMVPIFGTVGAVDYAGTIDTLGVVNVEGTSYIRALVSATGTGRIGAKGSYEILDAAGQTVVQGPLGKAYVLRGGKRWFSTPVADPNLVAGRYTLRASFNAAHFEQPIVSETVMNWPVPPMVMPKSDPNQPSGDTAADHVPDDHAVVSAKHAPTDSRAVVQRQ